MLGGLALIVVDLPGGHLDIAKAIGAVQAANGFQIPFQRVAAIAAVAIADERGRYDGHALANGLVVEVVVAGDFELDDLMAIAAIDRVVDVLLAVGRRGGGSRRPVASK